MSEPDPRSYNVPEAQNLRPEQLDNVARALLTLTREVAVLSDRVMVLEEILEGQGFAVRDLIDKFQPDEAFRQRSGDAMQVMLQNVFAALQGADV